MFLSHEISSSEHHLAGPDIRLSFEIGTLR